MQQTVRSGITKNNHKIGSLLVDWYRRNARDLPWRKTADPYRILVSEIMLQQTRVETVQARYQEFLTRFPDVRSLASATEDEVLKAWEGLGYYRRARNLHAAAQVIVSRWGGILPAEPDQLLAIPGIGPYTAAAVSAIAFGRPCAAVDANVLRIFARLYMLDADISSGEARKTIEKLVAACVPVDAPGEFAQALMDVGSRICLGSSPACSLCPVQFFCAAHEAGRELEFPVRKPKAARRKEYWTAFGIICGAHMALVRRTEGLLGALYAFPCAPGTLSSDEVSVWLHAEDIRVSQLAEGPRWRHVFTHVVWEMTSYIVEAEDAASGFLWADRQELGEVYALPSAYRPLLRAVEARIA